MAASLLTGCGLWKTPFGNWNNKREDSQVNVVNEMENYLAEKYDLTSFYSTVEVAGVIYAGWNQSYDVMNCYLKGEEEEDELDALLQKIVDLWEADESEWITFHVFLMKEGQYEAITSENVYDYNNKDYWQVNEEKTANRP